jgi:hypothetical protein
LNTSQSNPTLEDALAGIPKRFRDRIISEFLAVKKRYSEAQFDSEFDSTGLSTGKFVETVLRFLQHELTGSSIPFGRHVPNIADECRKLIQLPKNAGNESQRIIVPRALVFLYTLRGKRGIGHVGGDVEANGIDAATIVRVCDWIICELIRIYHGLSLEEAQSIVDALSTRNIPDIWEVAGKKRVLRPDLSAKDKALLLAYSDASAGILVEDLFEWVEYSDLSMFKRAVITPLHKARLIEYDKENSAVYLSPLGVKEVESRIIAGTQIAAENPR